MDLLARGGRHPAAGSSTTCAPGRDLVKAESTLVAGSPPREGKGAGEARDLVAARRPGLPGPTPRRPPTLLARLAPAGTDRTRGPTGLPPAALLAAEPPAAAGAAAGNDLSGLRHVAGDRPDRSRNLDASSAPCAQTRATPGPPSNCSRALLHRGFFEFRRHGPHRRPAPARER